MASSFLKPRNKSMSKHTKRAFFVLLFVMALLVIVFILNPSFVVLQLTSMLQAGVWEDDPKNWNRAFGEEQPAEVEVVHSKFWKSDHFTHEYIFWFELRATQEWSDAFLRKNDITPVPSSKAGALRKSSDARSDTGTPEWFTPNRVESYEVWDEPMRGRRIWIDKTNGHIFIYESQL